MTALLQSYLFAWLFLLSVSLGALANLMVHSLTGGRWGEPVRPAWIAAARLLPLVALLFVPILLGMPRLYPWVESPGAYLNAPFFAARSIAYLAIWIVLGAAFLRADRASVDPASGGSAGAQRIAAAGLIVYGLTVSLAAVDWIASLTPHWYSSAFGLVIGTGQMLAGAAFGVAAASGSFGALARVPRPAGDEPTRLRFHDLGNLLLMYVLTWAYLAYTQFLIIWSENLPHEIRWYVPRVQTGWAALGIFLVAFHFFLPLLILLSRTAKRSPALLGAIAMGLLLAHLADAFWLVVPTFRTAGFAISWTDILALVVLAGVWGWAWRRMSAGGRAVSGERAHG
ncbi:MAG TPA: hypothetical protein VHQ02_12460 [Usitatibacter sp.]|jgi:hypothetical protein|nr:hypothetical protein [Usitatibacter sp.]